MSLKELHDRVKKVKSLQISLSAIMAGLVYVFTIIFSLYIPQTRGFFNFGEVGVYISALIGGPLIGFLAGSIGSSLADLTLGYYYYAPATFIIKGLEGLIAGKLAEILGEKFGRYPRIGGVTLITILSFLLYFFGIQFYIGQASITIAIKTTYTIIFNQTIWITVSIIFFSIITYLILKYNEISGWILSMACGGMEMVLGYFLYEQFILGYLAIAEVPFNIMQVLIGVFVATIVVHYIRRLRI